MPSSTDRLSLIRHTLADNFRIADYADNWNRLDAFPGIHICESGSRPTDWGERQEGMFIFETDTQLLWTWNGDSFVRLLPRGVIGYNALTAPVDTAQTTYQTVISQQVTVRGGNRRHRITVGAPGVASTEDLTQLAIYRDATQLHEWNHIGGSGGGEPLAEPTTLDKTIFDLPTAGTVIYSLQFRAVSGVGGTSTIQAGLTKPIFIAVEEA